jgi:DHA1 family tetracycline resistance protein-like MFS transporter
MKEPESERACPARVDLPVLPVIAVFSPSDEAEIVDGEFRTRLVAPDQQGQLQGATSSVQSLSQLVGPFLFTLTFAWFIGAQAPLKLPGAPFLLAAALLLLALVIAARTLAIARLR